MIAELSAGGLRGEQRLLLTVMDSFSRRVVGWFGTAPGFVDSLTWRALARGRMLTMPAAYGAEFRQGAFDMARRGEASVTQIELLDQIRRMTGTDLANTIFDYIETLYHR